MVEAVQTPGFSAADFASTVGWRSKTGQDGHGDPTYAASVDLPAHIEGGGETMMNAQGEEFVTKGMVIFPGTWSVKEDDELTLPSRFPDQVVFVKRCEPVYDESSLSHLEVYF